MPPEIPSELKSKHEELIAILDNLERLSWAVKTAPECVGECPGLLENGLCMCGSQRARLMALSGFRKKISPDVILALIAVIKAYAELAVPEFPDPYKNTPVDNNQETS